MYVYCNIWTLRGKRLTQYYGICVPEVVVQYYAVDLSFHKMVDSAYCCIYMKIEDYDTSLTKIQQNLPYFTRTFNLWSPSGLFNEAIIGLHWIFIQKVLNLTSLTKIGRSQISKSHRTTICNSWVLVESFEDPTLKFKFQATHCVGCHVHMRPSRVSGSPLTKWSNFFWHGLAVPSAEQAV